MRPTPWRLACSESLRHSPSRSSRSSILWVTFDWLARQRRQSRASSCSWRSWSASSASSRLYWAMDFAVNQLPERGGSRIRPWVFVGPALVILCGLPRSIRPSTRSSSASSMRSPRSSWAWRTTGSSSPTNAMLRSIRNTLGWIIIVPAVAVGVGLSFATLADKLRRGEAFAKSLIFLPMAVSFVGASVVWKFIYSFRPEGVRHPDRPAQRYQGGVGPGAVCMALVRSRGTTSV